MTERMLIRFTVFGDPMLPSSETVVYDRARAGCIPRDVSSWRKRVRHSAITAGVVPKAPFDCALGLCLSFTIRRPPSHYISGRQGEGRLRPGAPVWHTPPDHFHVDVLATTAVDALTALCFWTDRSQVCLLTSGKQYGPVPLTTVVLRDVTEGGLPPTFEKGHNEAAPSLAMCVT